MPSILEPLYEWADRSPDRLLYAFLDIDGRVTEQYTYAGFLQRTAEIARHIQQAHAMQPGERVLLAYPPGLEMICAFFAAVRLGLVPVPVYPPTRQGFRAALRKMDFIAADCGASAVLTDRAYYWSMKVNRVREGLRTWTRSGDRVGSLPWIVTSDADRGGRVELADRHSDLVFLQYTSGSTSDPKGVRVSHANLLANGDAVVDHLPVGVSWLPQYHDMGLIGYYLFFAMKGGTTYGFSPLDFIRRPALWLETISRVRGTASSAPNFAYAYCLRPGKLPPETFEGLDLTSLRFLMTAAEPVRAPVVKRFLDTFEPYGLNRRSFFAAYGLAEFTLAVSNYGRRVLHVDRAALHTGEVRPAAPGAMEPARTSLVSCGRPLGGAEVRIVASQPTPRIAEPGRVGEIWLRGPSRCDGYWNRPELTARTFGAAVDGQDGWLRTGDLGFVDAGELFVCGRAKDLIIVRGQNVYPQDVELLVERDPAVRKGCVAAFATEDAETEHVVVVAEIRDPSRRPDLRGLAAEVQRELGVAIDRFVLVRARTIPKTSSGKIARHRVRAELESGALAVIAVVEPGIPGADGPNDAPPLREPRQIEGFDAVLARYGLTGHETWPVTESGLDSVQLVELAQALKDHLVATGHGELASAVNLQVLQSIALAELCDLLEQVALSAPHARLRFQAALARLGREHRAVERAMMERDTRLRFDPRHLPRMSAAPTEPGAPVLLTGATGFFGPFLLASLLRQTDDRIVVLVRANDPEHGLARVLDGLSRLGDDVPVDPRWSERIEVVCGDLAATNLGLDTATWDALARRVHTIWHNGAWVNYLFDYAAMRDANVGGTNEVVRLAMSHRPAVLNHVSTTFVFGWSTEDTLFERDTCTDLDLLDFGYSQTKWAAEQVVFDAVQQGLSARVFRPALITPSVGGGGTHFDISVRLLAFMLQHGLGTTAQNQVSFMPADVAADNIVAIAGQPDSLGGTFHVTRDAYASMVDITNLLGELTGTSFEQYPLDAFVPEVIERCRPGDILFPLLEFFVRSTDNITAMEFKRYDNATYRRFRDASPHGRADPPLVDVVGGLLRFMRRNGIVDA